MAAGADAHRGETALGRGLEIGFDIIGEIRRLSQLDPGKSARGKGFVQTRHFPGHPLRQKGRHLYPARVQARVVVERSALQSQFELQVAASL